MYYEYARRIRQGVLAWMDENPGWRLIELDPREQTPGPELAEHLSGVISWIFPDFDQLEGMLQWGVPVLECGQGQRAFWDDRVARVTFDRNSISELAVEHFRQLGVEIIGYVGSGLKEDGQWMPRVAALREAGLKAGMGWVEHDLKPVDPTINLEWIWKGVKAPELVEFLLDCPKPVGLLAEDDYFGVMVCETAEQLGLKVPGDLVVLGQGDRVLGRTGKTTLSSVVIPGREIGRLSAEIMNDWIRTGRRPSPLTRVLPCREIAIRESTGGISRDLGIERAKRYMQLHAAEGATTGELAAVAGCSAKTLRNRFLKIYGIDLTEAIREARRDLALKLLRETDLEIGEVARKCGFSSASNFFNFVKRKTDGSGPAEYRRQFQAVQPDEAES